MSKVCAVVGCPNLKPCPDHPGRPRNAPWSRDRDNAGHLRHRRSLIAERGAFCERCGWATTPDGRGLHMHHVSSEVVQLLCRDCHRDIDRNAR
jgi:hypothetical protein